MRSVNYKICTWVSNRAYAHAELQVSYKVLELSWLHWSDRDAQVAGIERLVWAVVYTEDKAGML